jgi:hypothetical protein
MQDVAYRATIMTESIRQVIAYNYLYRLISVLFLSYIVSKFIGLLITLVQYNMRYSYTQHKCKAKVMVKLSLSLSHNYRMKVCWWSETVSLHILNLCTRWGEWSASCSCRFTFEKSLWLQMYRIPGRSQGPPGRCSDEEIRCLMSSKRAVCNLFSVFMELLLGNISERALGCDRFA